MMDRTATNPLLKLHRINKAFGGLVAVRDFNLLVQPGELVGLIGPNGAGKTTVFNLITGIYRPDSGSIMLGEQNITGLSPHRVYQAGVARTFQNIRLFGGLSVLDNVRVAWHYRSQVRLFGTVFRTKRFLADDQRSTRRAFEVLEQFGLAARATELARNLPYGEQRRLEIARALMAEPKLLLLDEPAAGMNPSETVKLMELIRLVRERFKLTVLLIEHQMPVVMGICERVVVMDFGEVVAQGAPAVVSSDRRVIEAYLGREDA